MAKKTKEQIISEARAMLKGIRENQEVLSKHNIDEAFADNLQAGIEICTALNDEIESLKEKLKANAKELDDAIAEIYKHQAKPSDLLN